MTHSVTSAVLVFWFGLGGLGVSLAGLVTLDTRPLFSAWSALSWALAASQAEGNILHEKRVFSLQNAYFSNNFSAKY